MPTPLPDIPGVYYGRIEGTFEGLPCSNILSLQMTPAAASGSADATIAAQVASVLAGQWPAFAGSALPAQYTGIEVQVYPLHTPVEPAAVVPLVSPGGVASNLAPVSTAILISSPVHRRGRGSQSRTYISPVGKDFITADGIQLTSTFHGIVQTAWDSFRSTVLSDLVALVPGSWEFVQVSKKTGQAYVITGATVEPKLSTQRRRARRNS